MVWSNNNVLCTYLLDVVQMKIIKDEIATLKRGRRVTVELTPYEVLTVIKEDAYYKLGGQHDDIMQGYIITDMKCVYWCSISQRWEEA